MEKEYSKEELEIILEQYKVTYAQFKEPEFLNRITLAEAHIRRLVIDELLTEL